MFSKSEASMIREEFWTTFGQYMRPIPSAEGLRINWINYKTGFKDVYFRMQTMHKTARIGIFITHNDPEIQEIFFEQFLMNQSFLESILGEKWNWVLHQTDENDKIVSLIYIDQDGLSVMNREHWHKLIEFFKPRIMALDEFWSLAKISFESLK